MRSTKILIALLLIIGIVLPVMVSCAETSTNVTTAPPSVTTAPADTSSQTGPGTTEAPSTSAGRVEASTNLPEGLHFDDNPVITFAYVEGHNGTFTARSIKLDEEEASSGDSVDAKIYERNEKVEESLGVEIEPVCVAEGIADLRGAIKTSLTAGDPDYDVIAGYQYFDIGLAAEGRLLNLNELENQYIDITKPYWATEYIENITYQDNVFWVTGDLALRFTGGMYGTLINKKIYDAKCLATYGDIYDLALSGNHAEGGWTLDLLMTMSSLAFEDIGSEQDVVDEDDQLGFVIEMQDPCDGIAFGCGIEFSKKNLDGSYTVTFATNQRTTDLGTKLHELYNAEYTYVPADSDSDTTMTLFSSGNVFCVVNKIYQAEVFLREMDDDFYILPCPKLNSDQRDYLTGLHDGVTLFGITYCSDVVDAAAATLEMLACESYNTVVPVYYDEALCYKYTRDDRAAEMIDIIRAGVTVDFAAAWSNDINGIVQTYRSKTALKNLSSLLRKTGGGYNTSMTNLLTKLKNATAEIPE